MQNADRATEDIPWLIAVFFVGLGWGGCLSLSPLCHPPAFALCSPYSFTVAAGQMSMKGLGADDRSGRKNTGWGQGV